MKPDTSEGIPEDLYEAIEAKNMKGRKNIAKGRNNGAAASSYVNTRNAFYDESRRQKPSLPKLSFLEGKE